MDDEVITPGLSVSTDLDEDKPQEVVELENDQKTLERLLLKEVGETKFPLIRAHIEDLVNKYKDIRSLLPSGKEPEPDPVEFKIRVQVKALIVDELQTLLDDLAQVEEAGMEIRDASNK